MQSFYKLRYSSILRSGNYYGGFKRFLNPDSRYLVLGVRNGILINDLNYSCFLSRRAFLFLFGSLSRRAHPCVVLGNHFYKYRLITTFTNIFVSHLRIWISGQISNYKQVCRTKLKEPRAPYDIGIIFNFPDILFSVGVMQNFNTMVREARILKMPLLANANLEISAFQLNYMLLGNYKSLKSSKFFLNLFFDVVEESKRYRILKYYSVFKSFIKSIYLRRTLKSKLSVIKFLRLFALFNGVSDPRTGSVSNFGHGLTKFAYYPFIAPRRLLLSKLFPLFGYFAYGHLQTRVRTFFFYKKLFSQLFQKRYRILRLKRVVHDISFVANLSSRKKALCRELVIDLQNINKLKLRYKRYNLRLYRLLRDHSTNPVFLSRRLRVKSLSAKSRRSLIDGIRVRSTAQLMVYKSLIVHLKSIAKKRKLAVRKVLRRLTSSVSRRNSIHDLNDKDPAIISLRVKELDFYSHRLLSQFGLNNSTVELFRVYDLLRKKHVRMVRRVDKRFEALEAIRRVEYNNIFKDVPSKAFKKNKKSKLLDKDIDKRKRAYKRRMRSMIYGRR